MVFLNLCGPFQGRHIIDHHALKFPQSLFIITVRIEIPATIGHHINEYCDNELGKFQGMVIYDMSSLEWTTKVELENQKYLVPKVLYEIIGGE